MGCWNGSCHFSGVAIHADDPVVIIPYVQFPYDLKQTWFPIYGKYNDYGSIDSIEETPLTDKLVEMVKTWGQHDHQGPTPFEHEEELNSLIGSKLPLQGDARTRYSELTYLFRKHCREHVACIRFGSQWKYALSDGSDIENIGDLVNVMERQSCRDATLEVSRDGKWCGISFLMIHRDVWEPLKKYLLTDTRAFGYMESVDKTGNSYIDEMLCTVRNESGIGYSQIRNEFLGVYSQGEGTYEDFFGEDLWKGNGWDGKDLTGPALEAMKDVFLFRIASSHLRRKMATVSMAGSQAENARIVKNLAEATLKVCDSWIKECEQRELEDEEESEGLC